MTIRKVGSKLEVEYDWVEVDGSLDIAVQKALLEPEVLQLAAGSDYVEQYYDIQVSANTVVLLFRPEPQMQGYRRIQDKSTLMEGGNFLEVGEIVELTEDDWKAIVWVEEVDSGFNASYTLLRAIYGNPPAAGSFEVKPEDRA